MFLTEASPFSLVESKGHVDLSSVVFLQSDGNRVKHICVESILHITLIHGLNLDPFQHVSLIDVVIQWAI